MCAVLITVAFVAGRGSSPAAAGRLDLVVEPQWGYQTIYCASDDGKRRYCGADTRGGVQLVRQRSGSPCDRGRTWGYDRNGIWVDRGCRAEFSIRSGGGGGGGGSYPGGQTIYCASDDGRRNWCRVDTRGGVQLVRQRSDSACDQGRTWGYDRDGIWVDRGCRAEFVTGRGGNAGPGPGYPGGQTIYCASDDGRRNWCRVDTRGGVRLVKKRSDASCDYGRDWGYDRNGIWVDRGCRADFATGER
jgi:Protein of unknown function (DUF3011)